MAYRDIPQYNQLTNTCGLSSLLMIAKPEGNSLEILLEDIANRMNLEAFYSGKIGLQLAEAYLLMKSCFNRTLSFHLRKNYGDEFYYFKMILLQQLEDRKGAFELLKEEKQVRDIHLFLTKGIIRKPPLYEYLFQMKTNLELKMLAFFYGGEQILFPSPDGTGCIFLDGKDISEKLETIFNHVADGMLIGLGYHWLAVRGMEEIKKNKYRILINDPQMEIKAVETDKIEKHFRFYAFKFDATKRKKMDAVVRRAFKLPSRKNVHLTPS